MSESIKYTGKLGYVELKGASSTNCDKAPTNSNNQISRFSEFNVERINGNLNRFYFKGFMNDTFGNLKIDSGSTVTIINLKFIKSENILIPINTETLRYPTGEKVPVMFKISVKIHIGKYSVDIIVFVGNITDDCILGSDFLNKVVVSNLIFKLFVDAPSSINNITDFQVCARIFNPEDNIPETKRSLPQKFNWT